MAEERKERLKLDDIAEELDVDDELGELARIMKFTRMTKSSLSDAITFYLFMKYVEEKKDREWRSLIDEIREKEREKVLETKKSVERILSKYEEMIDTIKSIIAIQPATQRRMPRMEVEA